MKVSVIIPNYNHAKFLSKRIDSVLQQTFKDFEVIILDDCSTDNSVEVINAYKNHPQITNIIINECNSGSTFKQWQKGVDLAKGELIWIAESDDYADKDFLLNAVNSFKQNSDTGLFFCDYNIIDENDVIKNQPYNYHKKFIKYFGDHNIMGGRIFFEEYLYLDNWIVNASAVVFKRDLFINCGDAYINYKLAGDWRMWADISLKSNIIFCNKKLNFFRTHSNNVRSKTRGVFLDEVISLYKYFMLNTRKTEIKNSLKNRICDLWLQSFETKETRTFDFALLIHILLIDPIFFLRAGKKILKNKYHKMQIIKAQAEGFNVR